MPHLWTLGGLSWRTLAVRTIRGSWDDNVFGQAARLGSIVVTLNPDYLSTGMLRTPFEEDEPDS